MNEPYGGGLGLYPNGWERTGSIRSDIARAKVYLHYVLDLWAHQWCRCHARGDAIMVGYADDFVAGFQYQGAAERFLAALKAGLKAFALIAASGRDPSHRVWVLCRVEPQRSGAWASRKPLRSWVSRKFALGFTHIFSKTRKGGVPAAPEIATGPDEGQAEGDRRRSPEANARSRSWNRGAGLAADAPAAQPKPPYDRGEARETGGPMAPQGTHSPSLAVATVRRRTPEAGARWVRSARRDLCAGRRATRVPTAIELSGLFGGGARGLGSSPGGWLLCYCFIYLILLY